MNQRTLPLLLALLLLLPFFASPVRAAEGTMDAVYTSFQGGNSISSGSGTANDPCNLFVDALAKVKDGGTIYIQGQAFINGDENGKLPFVIGKNVTITSAVEGVRPSLDVRPSGLVLGADVTFQDITLEFASKCHDAIFANGHALKLINVARGSGTREVDLFAGTLAPLSGDAGYWSGITLPASGACGRIYVEVSDSGASSKFGNLYGGSMNTSFSGAAEIYVKSVSANALAIGNVYACGALEADYSTMLDTEEPEPPAASAINFPVSGDVLVSLDGKTVSLVDGTTGSASRTSFSLGVEYTAQNTTLNQIDAIEVTGGIFMPILAEGNEASFSSISVAEGAELDLSGVENWSVGDFHGGGTLTLAQTGSLSVSGTLTGQTAFQTTGGNGYYGTSGLVINGNSYIVSTDGGHVGSFTFNPYDTQTDYALVYTESDGLKKWTTSADGETAYYPPVLASISLPASYTLSDGNTGLRQGEVPVDVQYAYRPNPYTGICHIPMTFTLNGEAAVLDGNDSFGYSYIPSDASVIRSMDFFYHESEYSEIESEYLRIEGIGEAYSIPSGTYEIGVTIPGEYMLDEQDESLHFTLIVEESGPLPLPGDMNGDGRLSLGDAIRAARIAAFIDTPTAAQLRADTDENGRITIEDVLYICRSIANIQTTV